MNAQSIFIETFFYLFKEIYHRNPVAVRSFEGRSHLWSISAPHTFNLLNGRSSPKLRAYGIRLENKVTSKGCILFPLILMRIPRTTSLSSSSNMVQRSPTTETSSVFCIFRGERVGWGLYGVKVKRSFRHVLTSNCGRRVKSGDIGIKVLSSKGFS